MSKRAGKINKKASRAPHGNNMKKVAEQRPPKQRPSVARSGRNVRKQQKSPTISQRTRGAKGMVFRSKLVKTKQDQLSLLSYNILHPESARPEKYLGVSPDILSWKFRKKILCDHISRVQADVICLQEVCRHRFAHDFGAFFSAQGYDWVVQKKKKERNGHTMGNVTLFRRAKWALEWDMSRSRTLTLALSRRQEEVMPPSAGSLGAHPICNERRTCHSKGVVYVVNVHLEANPVRCDYRVNQIKSVLTRIHRRMQNPPAQLQQPLPQPQPHPQSQSQSQSQSQPQSEPSQPQQPQQQIHEQQQQQPQQQTRHLQQQQHPQPQPQPDVSNMVICGDFNSDQLGAVHHLLKKGHLPASFREEVGGALLSVTKEDYILPVPFQFSSVYRTVLGQDPETYMSDRCAGACIDFLWHSKGLRPVGVLKVPGTSHLNTLPCVGQPSDHLLVAAVWDIVPVPEAT